VNKREHFHQAADGTRLYACDAGPLDGALTPLLCLPGLTRHAGDFETVFERFAKTRRVIAIDFRGRGKSAHASDPSTYRPDVELQDTLGILHALEVERVALLGTSRGGIVGLLMASLANHHLAGLLLNDVGCKLEKAGLLRIRKLVTAQPVFKTWDEAAKRFGKNARGFKGISQAQWLQVVRRIFVESAVGIAPVHDPALANTLPSDAVIKAGGVAELWTLLPALGGLPFALLHGAGSDLLSADTVEHMQHAAPELVVTTVAKRGHVPFLDEPESIAAISDWLGMVDQRRLTDMSVAPSV
jgi:pimeloyl-ACP methyl ester carboxylesterase